MGKKVREYKSGDFIFAKVKGYPAWPARVQKPNGKKYFVYFYGTGETANLPPNMIFDYVENKDKFLTKTVKRRDFNDGVKQIEYDFANNVPLEEVIGVPMEAGAEPPADESANDSAIDATMDDSAADTTANDTVADDANTSQTEAAVEDSDDAGALVIDEGKTPTKGRKAKAEVAKGKETPKPGKTPRGKPKKEEPKEKEKEKEDDKIDEELVSRSGRKIRPKRYMDEQTEDNATLPSPAPKKRRASPVGEKEKQDTVKEKEGKSEKTFTQYNVVKQSELEGLKKPFEPAAEEDKDKENILIAYLPNSAYAGIRVFQSRPKAFKNEAVRLQWDKQAARNALTLKMQLEREHITPQSVAAQLVMELNLTDEEKATLDKERETEEKKSRVNFLKTEMKLIELDAKIKTCLCLEKADTELCLKLLDELLGLEVRPLMLLKHPTCLETVKRMRAYVGNTPSWDLSEQDALTFSKQAHTIRRKADALYKNMKEHFQTPEGLSFWEYFSERVLTFKKVTANLNAGELLELVHEPIELSQPSAHTMRAAIDEANNSVPPLPDAPHHDQHDKKKPAVKPKKPAATSTPSKSRRTRNRKEDDPEQQDAQKPDDNTEDTQKDENGKEDKEKSQDGDAEESSKESPKEADSTPTETNEDVEMAEAEKPTESEVTSEPTDKDTQNSTEDSEASEKSKQKPEKPAKETEKPADKSSKKDKKSKEDKSESEKSVKENDSDKSGRDAEKKEKRNSKDDKNSSNHKSDKNGKESEKSGKESEKSGKESDKSGKEKEESEEKSETDKSDDKLDEPRAKRSRESKKTEPPPRSPAKRKSKF